MSETSIRLKSDIQFGHVRALPVEEANQPQQLQATDAPTLHSKQVMAYDPTQYCEISDWVIIRIFQELYTLLMQFLGVSGYDSGVNFRLYNAFLNVINTKTTLQNLSINQYEALKFLTEFCENENHIPKEVKNQLRETTAWAKSMQEVFDYQTIINNRPFTLKVCQSSDNFKLPYKYLAKPFLRPNSIKADTLKLKEKQGEILNSTVKNIQKRVRSLGLNESTYISTMLGGGKNHLLLKVTNTGSDYTLTVVTRDSEVQAASVIAAAGKHKMLPGVPYVGVQESEFCTEAFFKPFLMLAAPADDEASGSDRIALLELFRPFQNKQDLLAQPQVFKTATDGINAIRNLSLMTRSGPIDKFNLGRRLHFGFYSDVRFHLKDNYMLCRALAAGNIQLRRELVELYKQDKISESDLKRGTEQFDRIEKDISEALNPKAPPPPSAMPTGYDLTLDFSGSLIAPALVPPKTEIETSIPHVEKKRKPYKFPDHRAIEKPSLNLPAVDVNNPLPALQKALQTLKAYVDPAEKRFQSIEAQVYFMEFIDTLPFENLSENALNKSPWHNINEQQREEASKLLLEMSQVFQTQVRLTQTILPDRFYALTKAAYIIDLLAHLNCDRTGYKWHYNILPFKKLTDFLQSGFDLNIKGINERIRYASPFLRLRSLAFIDKINALSNAAKKHLVKDFDDIQIKEIQADDKRKVTGDDYFHQYKYKWKTIVFFKTKAKIADHPVDFTKPQNQHLKDMVELFELFLPTYATRYFEIDADFDSLGKILLVLTDILSHRRRCAMLGRPIQESGLLGAAAKTSIGTSKDNPMLEAQLVFDPKEAYKKALKTLEQDDVRLDLPPDVSDADLMSLIKALDSDSAIVSTMAILDKCPYLLQIPDVRNAIEMQFLNPNSIKSFINNAPRQIEQLPRYFQEKFSLFYDSKLKRNDYICALFIIHLSRSMQKMLAQENKIPNLREADVKKVLGQEFRSLQSNSQYKDQLPASEEQFIQDWILRKESRYLPKDLCNQLMQKIIDAINDASQRSYSPNFYSDMKKYLERDAHIRAMPTFDKDLLMWAQKTKLLDNPQLNEARSVILTYWLDTLLDTDRISEHEIKEIVLFNMQLKRSRIFESDTDPALSDKVQQLLARWTPAFETAFNIPEFKTEVLDLTCQFFGQKVPDEEWSGTYPAFECASYKINLATGYIARKNSGRSQAPLSPAALCLLRSACPDQDIRSLNIERIDSEHEVYQFTDEHGIITQIEIDDKAPRLYKSIDGGCQWLQYVPRNQLFPKAFNKWIERFTGMAKLLKDINFKDAFKDIAKTFLYAEGIPETLLGEAQFVDASDPKTIVTFDKYGKSLFKLSFDKKFWNLDPKAFLGSRLQKIEDVRPEFINANKGRVLAIAGSSDADFLKHIARFENLNEVILWGSKGKLEAVELTRLGLLFEIQGSKLICKTKEYDGYTLDLNPSIRDTKGIQSAIVLCPPNPKQNKVLLVAKSEDLIFETDDPTAWERAKAFMKVILILFKNARFAIDSINAKAFTRAMVNHLDIKKSWSIAPGKLQRSVWKFEITGLENELRPPEDAKPLALVDFMLHQQIAMGESHLAALQSIGEIASNMRTLEPSDFDNLSERERNQLLDQLKKIIQNAHVAITPEEVGLALKCLLLLQERMPAAYQNDDSPNGIKAFITEIFGLYLRQSKKCDIRTRISPAELKSCFAIYKEKNPHDYAKIAPYFLLDDKEHSSPIDYTNTFTPLSRRSIEPVQFGAMGETNELARLLKYIPDTVFRDYRPYFISKQNIEHTFRSVYTVLRTEDPNSMAFQELDTSLNLIATTDHERSFQGRLIRYLQMLCQYRKTASQDKLPPLPQLERTKKTYNLYYSADNKRLVELEKQESETINAFFTDLDRRIRTPIEETAVAPSAKILIASLKSLDQAIQSVGGKERAEQIFQTLTHDISEDHPLNSAFENLDKELDSSESPTASIIKTMRASDNFVTDPKKIIPHVDELTRTLPATAHGIHVLACHLKEVLLCSKTLRDIEAAMQTKRNTRRNAHELANMTAAELEAALNAKGAVLDPTENPNLFDPIKDLQTQHALFSKAELNALFEKRPVKDSLRNVVLDLSLALDPTNPQAVKDKAQTLQNWVQCADDDIKQDDKQPMALKGQSEQDLKASKEQLLKLIEQKHTQAASAANDSKKRILNLLSFDSNAADVAKHKAGYLNPLTWTELLICFYRGELDQLETLITNERRIPPGTTVEELRCELIQFFVHSIDAKRTDPKDPKSLYSFLETMEKEKTLSCSFTCNQLHSMLTQSRIFNDDKESKLLLTEYYLGFLFRDIQIDFVEELQKNPNLLKQAATGSGKTAAIIPILTQKIPNGTNLVTMKFLNPLLQTSLDHLRGIVTHFLRRRVLSLSYNADTPIEISQGPKKSTSLFETFYKDQARAVLAGDVVVPSLVTSVNMDAKLIALCENKDALTAIDKHHCHFRAKNRLLVQNRESTTIDESDAALDVNHKYLTCIKDESIKPASHLVNAAVAIFDYIAESNLGLTTNTQADLHEENRVELIQQTAKKIAEIITQGDATTEAAQQILGLFIPDGDHNDLNALRPQHRDLLYQYFTGVNDAISRDVIDKFKQSENRDTIAVIKDLFSTILPTALSKKGASKYILASDGIAVVPTEQGSPGKPSAMAIFQHPIVRMAYINMWYRQMGVHMKCLERYTKELTERAISDLAEAHARKDPIMTNLDKTPAGEEFLNEFGTELGYKLSDLSKESKIAMLEKINAQPHLVRKFITYVCKNISITSDVTNASSHSLVACSRFKCGVSATRGCPDGYHREFDKTNEKAEKDGLRIAGESLRSLKSRFDPLGSVIVYEPNCKNPTEIVKTIKEKCEKVGILIDGSTDTANADPLELAKVLKGDLKKITYWDNDGHKQVYFDPAYPNHKDAGLDESGTLYTPAQSRGADNVNSTAVAAVLLPNLNGRLEEAYQHVGRLRRRDHQVHLALPLSWEFKLPGSDTLFKMREIVEDEKTFLNHPKIQPLVATAKQNHPDLSGRDEWTIISNVLTTIIINKWAINEAEALAEELYKNDLEAAIDEVREAALRDLVAKADTETDPLKGGDAIHEFYTRVFKGQEDNPLIVKSKSAYTIPGAYHTAFKGIASKTAPVSVLEANKQKQIEIIKKCIENARDGEALHLKAAQERLEKLDYAARAHLYPEAVYVGDASDEQAEIEVNTEQEAQTSIEVNIQAAKSSTAPSFENWEIPEKCYNGAFQTYHPAYAANLHYTRNYFPTEKPRQQSIREHKTERLPHDDLQKPLHYVLIEKDSAGKFTYTALDERDYAYFTGNGFLVKYQHDYTNCYESFVYDLSRDYFVVDLRGIDEDSNGEQTARLLYGNVPRDAVKEAEPGLVQLMVESGKVSGFTPSQEEALKTWLNGLDIQILNSFENYLTNEVHQYKPRSQARYPTSKLQQIISECREQKSGAFKSHGA